MFVLLQQPLKRKTVNLKKNDRIKYKRKVAELYVSMDLSIHLNFQRWYGFLCQSSASNLNYNLLWRMKFMMKHSGKLSVLMLKCCDYSFYLRVETILLELFAGKFIVQIIWSLKCGIKWIATINRLVIYVSVVGILTVSLFCIKK